MNKEDPEVNMTKAETKDDKVIAKPAASDQQAVSLSEKWTNLINAIRKPIIKTLLTLVDSAAARPKLFVAGVITFSIGLMAIGIFTNFQVDVDEDVLWTPQGTRPLAHNEWIEEDSGFPLTPRNYLLLIHADGDNVVSPEGISRLFTALDTVRNTTNYDAVCAESPRDQNCDLVTATKFWNNSVAVYDSSNPDDFIVTLSKESFPDDTPVDRGTLFGRAVFDETTNEIVSAKSFFAVIRLPETDAAEDFETDSLDNLEALKDEWLATTKFRIEYFAQRSFADEFTRAIVTDIPLIPAVFIVMSVFTCIVFFRRDWVFSRSLLGFGAVVSVLLSIMTGYGLLFTIGVPFTSMTQILPFIMFGIGVDAAFIISGAYARTDKSKTPEERVHDTMEDVGLSITLTTLTSIVAFALGSMSDVPAVKWLCLYAFPTIFFDFLYQVTFFIALIVIDEKRVAEKRRDCLVCCTVKSRLEGDEVDSEPAESSFDRMMGWFAELLFRPWMKALVLLAFAGLLGACAYSASNLTQEFDFTDVVPSDSYVTDFWDNFDLYTKQSGIRPGVYFRDVDQSDPAIQAQMEQYIDELVALREISDPPVFFWLKDFRKFVNETDSVANLSFNDQVAAFLDDSVYHELYSEHIVLNANGDIVASRTELMMDEVDQEDVNQQVDALRAQADVGARQSINKGRKDWAFFTFDGIYFIWEFYSAAQQELTLTTILGIIAVTAIAFLFIPHWSAALFVFPLIGILYVDLLGVLQFAGLHINAVSYISLVMSIGLLVDFLMHVLLRYYESPMDGRHAKVKDTLKTMGSSILVGAISTFLGVIPLAFSTSEIFTTIFVTFIGLVTLGAGHGLILLPVILSMLGPNVCIRPDLKGDQDARGSSGVQVKDDDIAVDKTEIKDETEIKDVTETNDEYAA